MNRGLCKGTYFLSKVLMPFLIGLGLADMLYAADPFDGTWKVILSKSTTSYPDYKLEGNFQSKIEVQANEMKAVEDLKPANGNAVQRRWTAKFDGKDYPVEGDPTMDAISIKKSNPNTINYVLKKDGKQLAAGKLAVSKDGKTSTNSGSATIGSQVFTYNIFLEKQQPEPAAIQ
jgi:hypothetical protein